MSSENGTEWGGTDRRSPENGRRLGKDRRVNGERRGSGLGTDRLKRRSLRAWVRTVTNPRLGIDRRKRVDQRSRFARRKPESKSILSGRTFVDFFK